VMSTLAVFIALGGSSYAAFTINGKRIENRSIAAKKTQAELADSSGNPGVATDGAPRA